MIENVCLLYGRAWSLVNWSVCKFWGWGRLEKAVLRLVKQQSFCLVFWSRGSIGDDRAPNSRRPNSVTTVMRLALGNGCRLESVAVTCWRAGSAGKWR